MNPAGRTIVAGLSILLPGLVWLLGNEFTIEHVEPLASSLSWLSTPLILASCILLTVLVPIMTGDAGLRTGLASACLVIALPLPVLMLAVLCAAIEPRVLSAFVLTGGIISIISGLATAALRRWQGRPLASLTLGCIQASGLLVVLAIALSGQILPTTGP